jgi:hypothetical protein
MSHEENDVLGRMITQAREVGGKALERLRGLARQLPQGAIEHVERLHGNPAGERRKAARLADWSIPVAVRPGDLTDESSGVVRDRCPTGLAVVLPRPAAVGTFLRVRLPAGMGGGWVTVEVRHCREEPGGWVAGCELAGNQPPI